MAARQFIYHMRGLTKAYAGGKKILENVNLSFYPEAKIGVLGVNGSGKSTLLRVMAGIDKEFTGEGFVAEGARVGYLPQEPPLDPSLDVRGNVMLGVKAKTDLLERYNELAMNYSDETADEMTRLQDEIEAQGLWDLDSQVEQAMEALGCPPDDADVTTLSGGERRRVALCKLLLEKPGLLLLDEPTNHLDAETVNWLEGHLRAYPGAILIVTHDRYFLDNVTGWILELDRGKGIPYEGNYSAWLKAKQKRIEQEKSEDASRTRAIAEEAEWMAASPKARQAKNKARIARYDDLVARQNDKSVTTATIVIPVSERLGTKVIEFDGIEKAFGDRLLIDGLTFKLPPGGIVGVIGPNGAGKTTLFRMITQQEQPDKGKITVADSVQLGYVDQSRDALNPNKTVWEEISEGAEVIYLGKKEINSRAYCGAFNFKGGDHAIACIWPKCSSAAPTFCCSTNRPTISTSTRCARLKTRCWTSPAARWSSAMIASSSTASPRTCWRSRATAMSSGSRAISPITRRTRSGASGSTASFRTASNTRNSRADAAASSPPQYRRKLAAVYRGGYGGFGECAFRPMKTMRWAY
jgi:ATP-binding cassette ChvD family protein